MKNKIWIGILAICILMITGCTSNTTHLDNTADLNTTEQMDNTDLTTTQIDNTSTNNDATTQVSNTSTNNTVSTTTAQSNDKDTNKVDLNITEKMYVTYINEIYTNPDSYLGKRLKIEGMFSAQHIDVTDMTYYYVYRQGPGCCGNDGSMCGFEFTSKDGKYPNENDWIEVVGKLDKYDEDGIEYLTIRADSVTIKDERGLEVVTQ